MGKIICWVSRNCSLWTCWNCKIWRCIILICCKTNCCWRWLSEIASSLNCTSRSSVNRWEILRGIVPGRTGDKGGGTVDLAKAPSTMATLQMKDKTKLIKCLRYVPAESITSPCGYLKELRPWGNSAIRPSRLSCCMKLMSTLTLLKDPLAFEMQTASKLATSHPNHAKMPGHHFHPRRNVEAVQPSQVKYPLTHCRLNYVEEEKDNFDVALQIPWNERPDKLKNPDSGNSNRTDANAVRRLTEAEASSSTYQ